MKALRSPCLVCGVHDRGTCWQTCEALAAYRSDLDRLDPIEAAKVDRLAKWCLALSIASGASPSELARALEEPIADYPFQEEWGEGG